MRTRPNPFVLVGLMIAGVILAVPGAYLKILHVPGANFLLMVSCVMTIGAGGLLYWRTKRRRRW